MSKEIIKALNDLQKFNYENIYYKVITPEQKEKYKKMFETVFETNLEYLKKEQKEKNIYKIYLDNMTEEYINLSPKGLDSISAHLDKISPKIQSIYLSSLIDEMGKRLGHLPSQKREMNILFKLNKVLNNKISSAVQLETLRRLDSNRKERILENGRYLLRKAPTNNLKSLIKERSQMAGR